MTLSVMSYSIMAFRLTKLCKMVLEWHSNGTQLNGIQRNDTQYNVIRHDISNETWHNDAQRNEQVRFTKLGDPKDHVYR